MTLIAVATVTRAFTFYMWAGEDDDIGALAGSRADERQKLISLRSRALACNLVAISAFLGLTAAVALTAAWWWPFAVILAVTGVGYLFGLSTYGVAQEGIGDDADTGFQAPSPARQLSATEPRQAGSTHPGHPAGPCRRPHPKNRQGSPEPRA